MPCSLHDKTMPSTTQYHSLSLFYTHSLFHRFVSANSTNHGVSNIIVSIPGLMSGFNINKLNAYNERYFTYLCMNQYTPVTVFHFANHRTNRNIWHKIGTFLKWALFYTMIFLNIHICRKSPYHFIPSGFTHGFTTFLSDALYLK